MNRGGIAAAWLVLGIAIGAPATAGRIERLFGTPAAEPGALQRSDAPGPASKVPWIDAHHASVAEPEVQTHGVAGSFFGGAAVLPLRGVYKVCRYSACGTTAAILRAPPMQAGMHGVGIGGSLAIRPDDFIWFGATGTLTLPTFGDGALVRSGSMFVPGSGSTFSSAARHREWIRVVSPFSIEVQDLAGGFHAVATLGLHFAPEPGTLTLLGAGIVVLVSHARRRR